MMEKNRVFTNENAVKTANAVAMRQTFWEHSGGRLLLAGMAVTAGLWAMACFGLEAYADVPDGLWEYTSGRDGDGNIVFDFKEVEVTLPADWAGKCSMVIGNDHVDYYHIASRDAIQENQGIDGGGKLLSLYYSEDYEFMDVLPNYFVVGNGAEGIYYVTLPTDVQGYIDDASIWEEWQQVNNQTTWVRDSMAIIAQGEGVSEDIEIPWDNTEDYILADSSSRNLDVSELEGMSAGELQMAINEIYARHHRKFVIAEIQEYFDSKSWYSGTIEAEDFDPNVLSLCEGQNIALMLKCMNDQS